MIKGEAVKNVRYDEFYDSTNGFREESDFQQGVKKARYKLVFTHIFTFTTYLLRKEEIEEYLY